MSTKMFGQETTGSSDFNLSASFSSLAVETNGPSMSQVNRFQNPATQQQSYKVDDRPINAKGSYNFDNIEFEDDYAEKQEATQDQGLMDKVMAGMKNFLQRKVTKKQDAYDEEESKGNSISANSIDQPQAIGDIHSGIEKRKNDLRNAMGNDVF